MQVRSITVLKTGNIKSLLMTSHASVTPVGVTCLLKQLLDVPTHGGNADVKFAAMAGVRKSLYQQTKHRKIARRELSPDVVLPICTSGALSG